MSLVIDLGKPLDRAVVMNATKSMRLKSGGCEHGPAAAVFCTSTNCVEVDFPDVYVFLMICLDGKVVVDRTSHSPSVQDIESMLGVLL